MYIQQYKNIYGENIKIINIVRAFINDVRAVKEI